LGLEGRCGASYDVTVPAKQKGLASAFSGSGKKLQVKIFA
jgi:hypothetical protein